MPEQSTTRDLVELVSGWVEAGNCGLDIDEGRAPAQRLADSRTRRCHTGCLRSQAI